MTIEERIKEIQRLCDMGIAVQDDVRFLLSELKRCREALSKVRGRLGGRRKGRL